jgi:hypothetical protein
MMSQYNHQTSLGLPEWVERVGAYAGLWVTGLILLFVERRNQTVRHHARQSLLIFGILSLIGFVVDRPDAGGGVHPAVPHPRHAAHRAAAELSHTPAQQGQRRQRDQRQRIARRGRV